MKKVLLSLLFGVAICSSTPSYAARQAEVAKTTKSSTAKRPAIKPLIIKKVIGFCVMILIAEAFGCYVQDKDGDFPYQFDKALPKPLQGRSDYHLSWSLTFFFFLPFFLGYAVVDFLIAYTDPSQDGQDKERSSSMVRIAMQKGITLLMMTFTCEFFAWYTRYCHGDFRYWFSKELPYRIQGRSSYLLPWRLAFFFFLPFFLIHACIDLLIDYAYDKAVQAPEVSKPKGSS